VLGEINPGIAIAGWLASLVVAGFVVRPLAAGFAAIERYATALRRDGEAPGETLELTEGARSLFAGVVHIDVHWRRRINRLAMALNAEAAVIETLPVPIILLGPGAEVVRSNRAAQRLFERESFRDIAAVVRNPSVLDAIDDVFAGAEARHVEFNRPPPADRNLAADIWRVPNSAGRDIRVAVMVQDLTAMKRVEQMRSDFIANASHELRTPLTSLAGFIDTLRAVPAEDGATRVRFLAIMEEQTERMKRVVSDLLSLSEIEMNEHTAPTDTVDIAELLDRVREAMEPAARARNVTLEVVCDSRLPHVRGEGDQLFQVFQNLVDNAIKYGDEDGAVTLTARQAERDGPAVAVAVSDRGHGIAREHLDRLTERFYRVDTARSRRLGGTGLGLAIVKHLVNRHRGFLEIESTLGRGSTFTVYLPAAEDERALAAVTEASQN